MGVVSVPGVAVVGIVVLGVVVILVVVVAIGLLVLVVVVPAYNVHAVVCYLFKTKRKNNQKKKFPTASLQTSGSLTVVKGQHGLASITKM